MGRKSKNKPVEDTGAQPPNPNPSQPSAVPPHANQPIPQQSQQQPQTNQPIPLQPQQQQPQQQQGPPQQQPKKQSKQPGPPQQQQGPPKQQQGPPKKQQGPPKQQQGPPKQQQGPPKQQQGPPNQQQGPPKKQQPQQQQQQRPLQQQQGPPQPQQGPPQQQQWSLQQPPQQQQQQWPLQQPPQQQQQQWPLQQPPQQQQQQWPLQQPPQQQQQQWPLQQPPQQQQQQRPLQQQPQQQQQQQQQQGPLQPQQGPPQPQQGPPQPQQGPPQQQQQQQKQPQQQQKPPQQQQKPLQQPQQVDSFPNVTASAAPSAWGQPATSQQSTAATQLQSAQGKKKNKYPQAKPTPAPVVVQEQQSVDNAATAVAEMNISPSKSSKTLQIPIASAPNGKVFEGTRGERHQVEVNYLQILVDKLIPKAYHYDVTFEPDLPKKMLGRALEVFRVENFKTAHFAFDGRKNLFTNIMLNIGESFAKEVTVADEQRSKKFKIKLQLAAEVDLSVLRNYQNPVYEQHDKPMQSLQALDIILRTAFKHANSAVAAGRSLYFKPNAFLDLTEGMELWYGLFQSAILGRKALYLNVDVSHKAFPSQLSLLDLLASFDRQGKVPRTLERYAATQFEDALKMLELNYKLPGDKVGHLWRFNKLVGSARTQTFTTESGKKMTIEEYFKNEKKIQLKFPELPCLHVGSLVRNIYLPLEFCEIPAGQATNKKCPPKCVAKMIRFSATSSDIRKKKIIELLSKINYSSPEIQGFGLNVGKDFQKVEARVLKPPDIKYLRGSVKPNSGVWDGSRSNFLETQSTPIKWGLINCDDYIKINEMINLKEDIFKAAERQNIRLERFDADRNIRSINVMRSRPGDLEELLRKCVNEGMKFVIVLIIDRNDCYAQVKQAAELKIGLLTQCIKSSTLQRMNGMTIANILLKINAKLNGRNHEIVEESYLKMATQGGGVMFVGGDVTHPSPDQKSIPSVVGVAASYDQHGFRYNCSWRLQPPKMEMIKDFENILVEHLLFYKMRNNSLPRKIMYYRDGVSDGQFQEVLSLEMESMKKACKRIYGNNPPAQITFVVVQKRHHTRFFPTDRKFSDGKNNNIKPGTVIDKDIVHPHQYQFFLASHAAIQGVTKPSKYCVLVNESKISPDDLQAITYDLCHLFTRCNRAVSYVAPTYYAHLVAARGKNYIIGARLDMMKLDDECKRRLIRPEIVNNSPMFFV